MLLTFEELQRGRPKRITNPQFGWRVRKRKRMYCQQPDANTIIVRRLDNPVEMQQDWKFTNILRVTPTEITFLEKPDILTLDSIGVLYKKTRDRSTDGLVFEWLCPRTKKWKSKVGRFPIQIRDDEVHVSPAGVRVVNEVKRRAFNAKLKEVRTFFRVRAKLGVFNHLDLRLLRREFHSRCANKSFVDVLNGIRVDDLDSFMPLLSWMFRHWWSSDSILLCDAHIDLLARFNATVDSERERCKLELGAITYEVPEADIISLPHTTGTPHDQRVELLATRGVRAV